MSELLEIGEFQFENLVHNRIPFVLVNLGADFTKMFPSFLQMHLESQMITTTDEDALQVLSAKHPSKDTAIVVICQNGNRSLPLAKKIAEYGYLNVYGLTGGRISLRSKVQTN